MKCNCNSVNNNEVQVEEVPARCLVLNPPNTVWSKNNYMTSEKMAQDLCPGIAPWTYLNNNTTFECIV